MSETLYRKVGRRYVPVIDSERWSSDEMRVGTWRMTYAYSAGGRRFNYEVKPDTASFEAACMLAAEAMERAIVDASVATTNLEPYTKEQRDLIERFRRDMAICGGLVPTWWHHKRACDIIDAGIAAVRKWKEQS